MEEIIIGFSKPKAFIEPFSWLIRLVTWAPYSHAYIKYYDPYTNRSIIFQASGLKVNFIGQPMFDSKENMYKEFRLLISKETKEKVIQKAVDICGSSYGVGQIIGFSWILLMRLFGKKVLNPFYTGNSFFCSELAADVIEEVGYDGLSPQTMDPKDLFNWLISKGFRPIS